MLAKQSGRRGYRAHIVQSLERRMMLSSWSSFTIPAAATSMLMLPDGSVMIQGGDDGGVSWSWNKLAPDLSPAPAGSPSSPYSSPVDPQRYRNGTLTPLAPFTEEPRQSYASDDLPNGNVFVVGGEHTDPNNPANLTESNLGEIFDPLSGAQYSPGNFEGTWTPIDPFPIPNGGEQGLGDAPSEVLSDGTVLVGDPFHSETQIFNPSTNNWTTDASMLYGDTSSE